MAEVKALAPAIKGVLTQFKRKCGKPGCKKCASGEGYLIWQLSYYSGGVHKNCHVGHGQLEAVKKVIENGKILQQIMSANGFKLVKLRRRKKFRGSNCHGAMVSIQIISIRCSGTSSVAGGV